MLRIVWYQNKCDKHHKKHKDHHITSLFRREVPQVNNRRKVLIINFFSPHFCKLQIFRTWVYQDNKSENLQQFRENCQILLYHTTLCLHLTDPFDPILKFALITSSIQNIFYFPLFFVVNNNKRRGLIDLIGERVYRCFSEKIRMKKIMNLHWLRQLQLNRNFFIPNDFEKA